MADRDLVTDTRERADAEPQRRVTTPHNPVISILGFVLCFAMLVGGFYLMSLFSTVTFVVGLLLSMAALFIAFEVFPHIDNA